MKNHYRLPMLILLFALAFIITACIQQAPSEKELAAQEPACGNGKLEPGETSANCCTDAGCVGEQTCVENVCENPECGECQYADAETGVCKEYQCCDDSACPDNEQCRNHECTAPLCGYCSSIKNHECVKFACCEDEDCNDNDSTTTDRCSYPKTASATCVHETLNECEKDADCNDNNATTKDICYMGKPHECMHEAVSTCTYNDGVCPRLCNYENDNDCKREVIECQEDDLECFTSALDDCATAEVTWTVQYENRTVEMDITTYMSVEEKHDDGECEIFFRTKKVELQFTDDYREELHDDYKYTYSKIDDLEDDAQDAADDVEGYVWRCYFKNYSRPVSILNNWADGDYDIEDFDREECSGDYFS